MDHKDLLRDAARIVVDREPIYGSMAAHFERVAKLASLKLDKEITPYEVLIVMESLKDARRAYDKRHYDSHVDGINYRAFAAEFAGASAPPAVKVEAPRSRNSFQDVSTVPTPRPPLSESLRAVDAAINGETKS